MQKYLTPFIILLSVVVILSSCSRKKSDSGSASKTNSISSKTELWKKVNTPPGADPAVSATDGGKGFEVIADSLGFETYVIKEDEMKYFGDSRAKTGGEIRTLESQFPSTFRPIGQQSGTVINQSVSALVFETLLATHPITRQYIPALASHWKISEDKLTFTFRIDPNARFSDGNPVVAEDVVATWKLMMDETILEPSSQLVYGKFEQPVALSKYIVQVKSKSLNFRNLLYFGQALQVMSHKEIGGITGKEFLEKFNYKMPVGSGEYILLENDIKKGISYTLTRRDDYWAKDYSASKYTGNIDRLITEVVKDNVELEYEKFKKGEVDLFRYNQANTEKWVKDLQYDALKNGWITRYRVFTDGPMGTAGYTFNMRKPPFDDIRVRQAFTFLHNRKSIVEKLLYNEYAPYNSLYPNTVYENPANPQIDYNPEKAAQLLAEAGWTTRNSQGILMKDGKPFVLEMALHKIAERFVTPYQQELEKAGIKLEIKFQDWNTIIKNIDERNFQLFFFGYGGLLTPNPETSLKSSLADKNNNNNIQGFKNKRVDELCDEYDRTFDVKRQVEIIQEIDKIAAETYMNAFSWNPRGIRFAAWNKFGMPEYALGRYTQLSYLYPVAQGLWWVDEEKVAALENAKQSKSQLPNAKTEIVEVKYWKEFSGK
ncbi:MAG: hypothetical protein JNL36_09675 [Candidatus Kapabacteria bacterium]|nr:hypothetical protein [Candidatus Kapabacteria bacterium]